MGTQAEDAGTARGLLDHIVSLMMDVATGGREIKSVQKEYRDLHQDLTRSLHQLDLQNPIPWDDIYAWRGYWKAHFATYAARRDYVRALADPTYMTLEQLILGSTLEDPHEDKPETWTGINVRLAELSRELQSAQSLDGWQDCGRRAREILVHLSKLMSEQLSQSTDLPEQLKAGDGKAWFEIFLSTYAAGSSHERLRKFYKGTWELAQQTTHSSVDEVEAFASAQAVVLLVRTTERMLQRGGASVTADPQFGKSSPLGSTRA